MRPATAFLLRILLLCAFFFSGGAAFSATANAESGRRVALVVGNGDYAKAGRLLNPAHDAVAVADELKALDFKVFLSRDVDQGGFAAALGEFLKALDGAEVGLFFFAGHGIQINGQNFLLSTNATGENEFLIPAEGMELASIIERMEQRAAISLVFVDACRNNPLAEQFARKNPSTARALGMTRGLARVDRLGRNTLVVYATAPNQTASDGNGRHSPFTAGLLRHMSTPGLEVSAMLKRVAGDVLEETGSEQQPEVVASMTSEFYFQLGEAASGTSERPAVVSDLDQRRVAAETAFEFAKKLGTLEAYRFFLQSYGDSTFADAAELAVAALEEEAKKNTNMDISIDSAFPGTTEHGGTAEEEIALGLNEDDRKRIQIVLSTLGYDTHGIDGSFGSGTRTAIKAFQFALNHEPTGFLSNAEYDYIIASQDRAKQLMGDRALAISTADLPEGADPRLLKAVEALGRPRIKFGIFDGTLYIAVQQTVEWAAARQSARKAGGDLAVISSKAENDFVFGLIEGDTTFWWFSPGEGNDASKPYFASGPAFGLFQQGSARSSREGWTWVDSSTGPYNNWTRNQQPNEMQLYGEVGAAAFGGPTTGASTPVRSWQDFRMFTQRASGFIIEIPQTKQAG